MSDNNDNIATELRQVAKGAGISGLGRISFQLLQITLGYTLAHTLKLEKLGLYGLGNTVARLTEKVACLGLHLGSLRYASVHLGEKDLARTKGVIISAILLGAGVSGVVLLVLVMGADVIANSIFHKPNLLPVLRVMVFAVPLFGLFQIATQITMARRTATAQVISSVVFHGSVLALFGLLWFLGLDIRAVVWAYVAAAVLSTLTGFAFLFKLFPVLFDRQVQPIFQVKQLLLFSLPLFLVDLTAFGTSRLDIFLVGIWCSEREVGIYYIAHALAFLGTFGLPQVAAVFRPIIADLHSRGEMARLGRIFKIATRWTATLSVPICLFLIVERVGLLGLFGKEFGPGELAIALLAGGHIVRAMAGNTGWMLLMSGRSWIAVANATGAIAVIIGLGYWLIQPYGIVGAAAAAALATALVNLVRIVEVRLLMGPWCCDLTILKPCAAGLLAAALIHLLPFSGSLGLGIDLIVYLLAYLSVLYGLGLDEADRLVLRRVAQFAGIRRPM